jgi:hypothetical protein
MPSAEEILAARDSGAIPEDKGNEVTEEKKVVEAGAEPEEVDDEIIVKNRKTVRDEDEEATVPRGALEAEREKRRKYTDEVEGMRKALEDVRRQNADLAQAVLRSQQPPPPAPEPEKPPDFDWDNPVTTVEQRIEAALQKERVRAADENRQRQIAWQAQREEREKKAAVEKHGQSAYDEAFGALRDLRVNNDPLFGVAFNKIMQAQDQAEALIQWGKERKAQAEVNGDFVGWKQRYREQVRNEYLDELRNGTAREGHNLDLDEDEELPRRRPRMPSDLSSAPSVGSRSGPTWDGPASIKDILGKR